MKRLTLGLAFALLGSCALQSAPALAEKTIVRLANGDYAVQEIKYDIVAAKEKGTACYSIPDLNRAYDDNNQLWQLYGVRRCFKIDVGDKIKLIPHSYNKRNDTVQIYAGDQVFLYTPGHVVGIEE